MKYRSLGKTGVQISVVGLGGNQFGSTIDEGAVKKVIDRAIDLGVNFIDSAESYGGGKSEETLGKALAGRRHDVVLATKTGVPQSDANPPDSGGRLTRKRMTDRLEASLKRLGSDYVDVYYFHFPDPLTPLEESMRAVDDMIRAGKVRYLAISNHSAWQVAESMAIADKRGISAPVASQSRYNLLDRAVEKEMLPACDHFGVSFIPYSPLAGGFLTGKYERGKHPASDMRFGRARYGTQVLSDKNFDTLEKFRAFASARGKSVGELAMSWLLAQPAVTSVIAGVTRPEQVDENVKAAEWALTRDEVAELAV